MTLEQIMKSAGMDQSSIRTNMAAIVSARKKGVISTSSQEESIARGAALRWSQTRVRNEGENRNE